MLIEPGVGYLSRASCSPRLSKAVGRQRFAPRV